MPRTPRRPAQTALNSLRRNLQRVKEEEWERLGALQEEETEERHLFLGYIQGLEDAIMLLDVEKRKRKEK